jgi:hypothetical protein
MDEPSIRPECFRVSVMEAWPRRILVPMSAAGRLCCKSLFAPLIANFSSCRRGFRVNMWGTPGDKLTGDFGNEPDATSISDRGLFRLLAGNLSPGVFATQSALLRHRPMSAIWPLSGAKQPLVDRRSRSAHNELPRPPASRQSVREAPAARAGESASAAASALAGLPWP